MSEAIQQPINSTPRWAYVFAGACVLLLIGGFVGAMCGFVGAGMCVAFSRNHLISIPRRIYACILTVGFAWVVYFVLASRTLSAMNLGGPLGMFALNYRNDFK